MKHAKATKQHAATGEKPATLVTGEVLDTYNSIMKYKHRLELPSSWRRIRSVNSMTHQSNPQHNPPLPPAHC
jgi:hypothetical protein